MAFFGLGQVFCFFSLTSESFKCISSVHFLSKKLRIHWLLLMRLDSVREFEQFKSIKNSVEISS